MTPGALRCAVWYPFDDARLSHASAKAHELGSQDIVLTTYDAVLAETQQGPGRPKVLLNLCWWRVVLDESQRVSKGSTLTTRTCCALSRVHSWLLSGTPVGNVVEDLLGQLLFLRVQPFCRMGEGVDNFWQREVTSRFRAHDGEALEIVDELLGSIMMRHLKAQSLTGHDGVERPIVSLPEMRAYEVAVVLDDRSERAVYLAFEAYCQEELLRLVAEKHSSAYIPLCGLLMLLARIVNHASLLNLDALDERLQRRIDGDAKQQEALARAAQDAALPLELRRDRPPAKSAKGKLPFAMAIIDSQRPSASVVSKVGGGGLLDSPRHLATVLGELPADAAGRARPAGQSQASRRQGARLAWVPYHVAATAGEPAVHGAPSKPGTHFPRDFYRRRRSKRWLAQRECTSACCAARGRETSHSRSCCIAACRSCATHAPRTGLTPRALVTVTPLTGRLGACTAAHRSALRA